MIELLFEIVGQLLFEIVLQGVFELGGRGVVAVFRRTDATHPALTIAGYMLMGVIAGAISVWLIPMHLLTSPTAQLLNLAAAPIILGFIFEAVGRSRTKSQKRRSVVDRFSYGFTFALTMGLIRYFFVA